MMPKPPVSRSVPASSDVRVWRSDLGNTIRAVKTERRQIRLRNFPDLAEHFARDGLIESNPRIDRSEKTVSMKDSFHTIGTFHYRRRYARQMLRLSSMIITRSSLRITLGGGATDLPAYYRQQLDYVKGLGLRSREALERGDTALFAALMHEHWEHKRRRSRGITNPDIDEWYELGRRNGAIGGKLVGAGGGGFLLFYAEDHRRLRSAMKTVGLEEVRFRFDFEGTKVLFG
jgi:hypothetical protein